MDIGKLTIYISFALPILFVINFKKYDKAYLSFFIYLFCIACIQGFSFYVNMGEYNIFLVHYMLFAQFISLSLFFFFVIKRKWVIWLSSIVLAAYLIQYLFLIKIENSYNPIGLAVCGLIFTFYAGRYLYSLLNKRGSYLYISLGCLIYFSISILVFGLGNIGLEIKKSIVRLLSDVNAYAYLIFQVLCVVNWYSLLKKESFK